MLTEQHRHTTRCWWDLTEARWICRQEPTADDDRPERPGQPYAGMMAEPS